MIDPKIKQRGIRNNNPGNIERGAKWQGLVTDFEVTDDRFCQFIDPTWGVRALAAILIKYQDRHGIRTISGIIKRWAPSVENDTAAYIGAICRATGASAHEPLDLHRYEVLRPIVEGIIRHENGRGPKATPNSWYDRATIDTGLQRAGIVEQSQVIAKVPVTKETVAASGTAAVGIAQLADVAPQVFAAVESQHEQMSSGSILRIVIGVITIGLAIFIAYSQIKKHQVGVVA